MDELRERDPELAAALEQVGEWAEQTRENLARAHDGDVLDDAGWKAAAAAFLDAWDGRQVVETLHDILVLHAAVLDNAQRLIAEHEAKRRDAFAGRDTRPPPS